MDGLWGVPQFRRSPSCESTKTWAKKNWCYFVVPKTTSCRSFSTNSVARVNKSFFLCFFFSFRDGFRQNGLLQVLMSLIFVRCFFFRLARRIRRLEGFTCSLNKWYTKIIRIYKAFEWLLEETHKVLHWLLSTRKCMTNSPLYLKCVYSGWDRSLYHHLLIIVRFYSSEMVIGT